MVNLKIMKKNFDIIVMNHVIEHIKDQLVHSIKLNQC